VAKGAVVAAEEPVTSPDQHKPGHPRAARIAAVLTIVALLAMLVGNNHTNTGAPFLIGTAAIIALILIGDWLLRKNGLR
jgi:Protein of unknown function (DUF2631)